MKGFSFIELIIVLAILAILAVISVAALSSVNKGEALTAETEKILSLLTEGRALTLAAKDGSAYGVHFETQKAVLFKGTVYNPAAADNQAQPLNGAVRISATSLLGGGSEVLFQKLTGATAQSGTVTIVAVQDASKTKIITIAGTGAAYSN